MPWIESVHLKVVSDIDFVLAIQENLPDGDSGVVIAVEKRVEGAWVVVIEVAKGEEGVRVAVEEVAWRVAEVRVVAVEVARGLQGAREGGNRLMVGEELT